MGDGRGELAENFKSDRLYGLLTESFRVFAAEFLIDGNSAILVDFDKLREIRDGKTADYDLTALEVNCFSFQGVFQSTAPR